MHYAYETKYLVVGEVGACGGELPEPELDPSEAEPWSPLWLSSVGYEEDCECEVFELEFCWLRALPAFSWRNGAPGYDSSLCRSKADGMALVAEYSAVDGSMGMGPCARRLLSLAPPCCSSSGHVSDFLLTRGRRSREPLGLPRERLTSPPSPLEPMLAPPLSCALLAWCELSGARV